MIFRLPNKNRDAFFRSQRIPPEKAYGVYQVHSRNVYTLGKPDSRHAPAVSLPPPETFAREGDGIVSFCSAVYCAVTIADCLPIFLLDIENGFFAILHSGWKGTGIVLNALEIMQREGSRSEVIAAILGPCIQSCCYTVDEERAKFFETEFGPSSPHIQGYIDFPLGYVTHQNNSSWYINMRAANARLLASRGVRNIAYCTDCTYTDTRLGSSRREGAQSYTRMIAAIGTK
jgi:YfiH family protein